MLNAKKKKYAKIRLGDVYPRAQEKYTAKKKKKKKVWGGVDKVELEEENGKLWGNFTNWWNVWLGKKYAHIVSLYWFI